MLGQSGPVHPPSTGRRQQGMEMLELRSDVRSRLFQAKPEEVFAAFSSPDRMARWWGPMGFTNTIHRFDFFADGLWLMTMHGPDGKDYPNESRFTCIETGQTFEIEHFSGHHFILRIELSPTATGTRLTWRQSFDSIEHYQRIAGFVAIANEQNLDRLASEIAAGRGAAAPPSG